LKVILEPNMYSLTKIKISQLNEFNSNHCPIWILQLHLYGVGDPFIYYFLHNHVFFQQGYNMHIMQKMLNYFVIDLSIFGKTFIRHDHFMVLESLQKKALFTSLAIVKTWFMHFTCIWIKWSMSIVFFSHFVILLKCV
jgi:hypothetical protein